MKKYTEVLFEGLSPELAEILVAQLSDLGYYGFLEEEGLLKAYVGEQDYEAELLAELASAHGLLYKIDTVEEENWNAVWESSFSPVVVNDFVAVRADFHPVVDDVDYEIAITPKMSFGTGHHATTYLVLEAMQKRYGAGGKMQGLRVLDFGTGTGLLAILAAKMGAGYVMAIDNDTWSIDNASENIRKNGADSIELALADAIPSGKTFDLILANINKHILLGQAEAIANALEEGGVVLLSGILNVDVADIQKAYELHFGAPAGMAERNNWMVMAFTKH